MAFINLYLLVYIHNICCVYRYGYIYIHLAWMKWNDSFGDDQIEKTKMSNEEKHGAGNVFFF